MTLTLICVLEEAREFLARPGNDFAWSSWNGSEEAIGELDRQIATLRDGQVPGPDVRLLFAPTGPIQEVSLRSGWGDAFLSLAERFDAALSEQT